MASKTYKAGQESILAHDLKTHARRLIVEFHREMHSEAGRFLRAETPVGHTGRMRASWGDRINGRDDVPASPRANICKIRLKSKSARINDHAGAAAIDFGRKRNQYKGFSRLGGSAKAPEGISEPGRRHVLGYAAKANGIAAAKVDRRFGK